MTKLFISKDQESYWLHIYSEKRPHFNLICIRDIDPNQSKTMATQALEETIRDQENNIIMKIIGRLYGWLRWRNLPHWKQQTHKMKKTRNPWADKLRNLGRK